MSLSSWKGLELQVCRFAKLNPKLSEPGAVEQGERAEAGRRGSSGAQSPPAGDRAPVPQAAAGCAVCPAIPRMRNPKPLRIAEYLEIVSSDALLRPPEALVRPLCQQMSGPGGLAATGRGMTLKTFNGKMQESCEGPPNTNGPPQACLPGAFQGAFQGPFHAQPIRIRSGVSRKLGASSQTQSQTFCSSQLVQGLIASKQKASSQAQPNIANAWSTRVEETNKKIGARETSSGGNWGPRANPKSKPCARLVWTGATSSRQVPSQNFICRKLGLRAKPKAKPSACLVWQVQLVHALIASKLKTSSPTSPNLAPAWSRQNEEKQIRRQERDQSSREP